MVVVCGGPWDYTVSFLGQLLLFLDLSRPRSLTIKKKLEYQERKGEKKQMWSRNVTVIWISCKIFPFGEQFNVLFAACLGPVCVIYYYLLEKHGQQGPYYNQNPKPIFSQSITTWNKYENFVQCAATSNSRILTQDDKIKLPFMFKILTFAVLHSWWRNVQKESILSWSQHSIPTPLFCQQVFLYFCYCDEVEPVCFTDRQQRMSVKCLSPF